MPYEQQTIVLARHISLPSIDTPRLRHQHQINFFRCCLDAVHPAFVVFQPSNLLTDALPHYHTNLDGPLMASHPSSDPHLPTPLRPRHVSSAMTLSIDQLLDAPEKYLQQLFSVAVCGVKCREEGEDDEPDYDLDDPDEEGRDYIDDVIEAVGDGVQGIGDGSEDHGFGRTSGITFDFLELLVDLTPCWG